jgi:hypothetical protein
LVPVESKPCQQTPNGRGDSEPDQERNHKPALTPSLQNLLECDEFVCARRRIRVHDRNLRVEAGQKV